MMNELKSLVVDALIFRYLERGIYFSYAHVNKIAALGLLRTELGTMVITSCARTLKRGTGMSKSPDDISMLVGNTEVVTMVLETLKNGVVRNIGSSIVFERRCALHDHQDANMHCGGTKQHYRTENGGL